MVFTMYYHFPINEILSLSKTIPGGKLGLHYNAIVSYKRRTYGVKYQL